MFSHNVGKTPNPEADMASSSAVQAVTDCQETGCVDQVVCPPDYLEKLLVSDPETSRAGPAISFRDGRSERDFPGQLVSAQG
jgi:hypothetical protein